jgi:hypothetical protein
MQSSTKIPVTRIRERYTKEMIDSYIEKASARFSRANKYLAKHLVNGNVEARRFRDGNEEFRKFTCDHFEIIDYYSLFTPEAMATREDMVEANRVRNRERNQILNGVQGLSIICAKMQALMARCDLRNVTFEGDSNTLIIRKKSSRKQNGTYLKIFQVTKDAITEIHNKDAESSERAGIELPD